LGYKKEIGDKTQILKFKNKTNGRENKIKAKCWNETNMSVSSSHGAKCNLIIT
jgi:hypothetical protein